MEGFDKYWGIAGMVATGIVIVFNVVLANLRVPEPGDPVPTWRKALLIVVAILGRVFGATTVANRGDKEGFELKIPVVQSAMPNRVPPKRD